MRSTRPTRGPVLPLLLVLATPALAAAAERGAPVDLAGHWIPDETASSSSKVLKHAPTSGAAAAPPPPAPPATPEPPSRLRVGVQGPLLIFELVAADGASIGKTVVTTDGAENVNSRGEGLPLHRSRSVWRGAVLETTWTIEQDGRVVISGTDRRERTGPDTLVVTTTTEDAQSTSRSVTVYRRAP